MRITLCSSGFEALSKIAEKQYALGFNEPYYLTPEMDGRETASRIRSMEGEYLKNVLILTRLRIFRK